MDININLPSHVREIIRRLRENGHEAYAVGGCVRDSLMGKEPQDWDVTTSARPRQVKELFCRTVDTGIQHGTVTVLMDGAAYEVTTYRIDGEYEDGRHPRQVSFTRSLKEDLRRRDFTINAMAYNGEEGLVDIFGGREDLEAGIIRCVGEARCRFGEDALRLMRAVRFSAQFGFSIEEETGRAMRGLACHLHKVSAERIQAELIKLLLSPHPGYLRLAYEKGLTAVFLPEFDRAMATPQNHPHHCYSVGEHLLCSLDKVGPDKALRLTMLLHDMAKPLVRETGEDGYDHFHGHSRQGEELAGRILRRLKLDNDTIGRVCRLVRYHDFRPPLNPAAVRRAIAKIGPELFPFFLQVQEADMLAQSPCEREGKQAYLKELERLYREILHEGDCLGLKDMAVTGKDLLELGMKPGKELGRALNLLLERVLEEPELNQREVLLDLAGRRR